MTNSDLGELLRSTAADDPIGAVDTDRIVARGERSLRRRRTLAAGATAAAVAVSVASVAGLTNDLFGSDPRPAPPVAGTSAAPPASASVDPPVGPVTQRPDAKRWNSLMTTVLTDHLDPGRDHVRLTGGEFGLNGLGGARTLGGRVAWRIAGQHGEGYVGLGLAETAAAISGRCGSGVPGMTCHDVRLPNGRTAQLGRKGEAAQVYYVQPDGELAHAEVNPLFANNTTIPLHDIRITDEQLLALVQDPRLNLPELTQAEKDQKAQLTGYKPSRAELRQAAHQHLNGGTLEEGYFENTTEDIAQSFTWKAPGITQQVNLAVYAGVAGQPPCLSRSMTAKCAPETLPDGRIVVYGEGASTSPQRPQRPPKPSYIKTALFRQPDGNWVNVTVTTTPAAAGAGITKQQLVNLATEPVLDK